MPPSSATRLRAAVETIIAAGAEGEALRSLSVVIRRVSTKRARGGGQSSKQKGRTFMARVAALIVAHLGLDEADVFVKATSQVGCDLHLSPRAEKAFPYAIEGKNVESLNIWGAIRQAEANADPSHPAIVFFTRAHLPTYVALSAEVFLELSRRSQSPGEGVPESLHSRAGDGV